MNNPPCTGLGRVRLGVHYLFPNMIHPVVFNSIWIGSAVRDSCIASRFTWPLRGPVRCRSCCNAVLSQP